MPRALRTTSSQTLQCAVHVSPKHEIQPKQSCNGFVRAHTCCEQNDALNKGSEDRCTQRLNLHDCSHEFLAQPSSEDPNGLRSTCGGQRSGQRSTSAGSCSTTTRWSRRSKPSTCAPAGQRPRPRTRIPAAASRKPASVGLRSTRRMSSRNSSTSTCSSRSCSTSACNSRSCSTSACSSRGDIRSVWRGSEVDAVGVAGLVGLPRVESCTSEPRRKQDLLAGVGRVGVLRTDAVQSHKQDVRREGLEGKLLVSVVLDHPGPLHGSVRRVSGET